MSRLISIIKPAGIIAGTGLAAYGGIEVGDKLKEILPQAYLVPQIAQGMAAFAAGMIGNRASKRLLGIKRLSEDEAYSILSLNAFASAPNAAREVTTEKSLEEISNNLIEVIADSDRLRSLGSGLMITTDGYAITAHHVIREMLDNGGSAMVKTQNGKLYPVKRENMWYNKDTDIAIIKASKPSFPAQPIRVKVNKSCRLERGDEVRVLGFRDGQKYNTMGMIINPNYTWEQEDGNIVYDLFQTDARGREGQSGGVIANGNGELIGIIVCSSLRNGENIGRIGGTKISNALNYINQIAAKKSSKLFR